MSSLLFGGTELIWFHAALQISARMIWINWLIEKWWTLAGMDASEKWMFIQFTPQQTTTPPKWMSSKNHPCYQMLVWHSSMSPKQQRRPLFSLLSNSSSMSCAKHKSPRRWVRGGFSGSSSGRMYLSSPDWIWPAALQRYINKYLLLGKTVEKRGDSVSQGERGRNRDRKIEI